LSDVIGWSRTPFSGCVLASEEPTSIDLAAKLKAAVRARKKYSRGSGDECGQATERPRVLAETSSGFPCTIQIRRRPAAVPN
jgi:hypothetical protein